jgi:hypothetical protein
MSVPSGINRDVWTEEDERDPNGWDVIDANARLHQRIRVAFDQSLNGYWISFAQYRILEMLNHTPKIHVGELARRLRVTRQAAHGVARQLRRADLVDEIDTGYWKGLWLTDHGRRWLPRYPASGRRHPA